VLAAIEVLACPPVCLGPWLDNPYELVSLWDIVQHFMAWQLAQALDQIREFECELQIRIIAGAGSVPLPSAKITQIKSFVRYWNLQFKVIELQGAIERIDGPLRLCLQANQVTGDALATELRVLRESVEAELKYRRFTFVPMDKARLLDGVDAAWESIWQKVPQSKTDAKEAVFCYALGRNTACVFHLMRVAEHGLRVLAKKVGAKLTHKGKNQPIEFADWDKVITEINGKTGTARALPHGAKRATQLKFYSDAADHCLYMKELRNEISHARTDYNPGEALGALQRVHGFMIFLSRGL